METVDDRILITEGDLQMAHEIMMSIPEFENPYPLEELEHRLNAVHHLILVAHLKGKPVGFKIGYKRDGNFYSWLGGVLPPFRRGQIAQKLANYQEAWAIKFKFDKITMKTRNKHKDMLIFALGNGFKITDVQKTDQLDEYRILLEKKL